ncbi:MAG: hypothetical protein QXJ52_06475 [Candidatus Korarchaeota archaeon]
MDKDFQIEKFLEDEDVKAVVRYLAAYREVEGDLGTLDELRRVRNFEGFVSVMSKLIRVKDRVLSKLVNEPDKYEVVVEGDRRKLFEMSETNLKKIYEYAGTNSQLTGKLLASLAFASAIIRKREGWKNVR